jgi:uncharacterized protein (DUF305 family)
VHRTLARTSSAPVKTLAEKLAQAIGTSQTAEMPQMKTLIAPLG